MRHRLWRRLAQGAAAVAVALAATVPVADTGGTQEAPAPDPILAIVSPIAAPVCTTAGTATLLVPILGGLVETNLGLDGTISVADVILDSLGPIYVVCGSLPASPGTRCQLDDQIAALVPAEATEVIGPPPPLLGNLVDALAATFRFLGLDAITAALTPALQCDVRAPEEAAEAPAGAEPPALPEVPGVATVAPPAVAPDVQLPTPLPPAISTPPAAPVAGGGATPQTLVDVVSRSTPGWVTSAQGLVGGLLVLFLAGSWATSIRVARRPAA